MYTARVADGFDIYSLCYTKRIMGTKEKDVANKADTAAVSQGSAVSVGSFGGRRPRSRTIFIVVAAVIAVGIATVILVHEHNVHSKDAAGQQLWETILHSSLTDDSKQQDVVKATSALLAGAKAGTYTISSTEQTQLYLDRANAYLNLKNYKQAFTDYNKVVALGGSTKIAALQGAVEAGYKAGERKELIPLYKELIALKLKSSDPMRRSVTAQYEQNIQTLEQGGELVF